VWSPDGKHLAYSANRDLKGTLRLKNADGSGTEQQLGEASAFLQAFCDWSHDGKYLLIQRHGELWYFSPSDQQTKPIFQGNWLVRTAQFSPDGKFIAYSSNETGSWEVYVSPFPNATSKWQVSNGGGEEPRWRKDGKELFYLSADRKIMAV